MTQLETYLGELLTTQRIIIRKLEEIIQRIEQHHRNCNISHTVAASTGATALLVAPFSSGATVPLALSMLTSLGTSITDVVIGNNFIGEVQALVGPQNESLEGCRNIMENLRSVVQHYMEMGSFSEEESWAAVLRGCSVARNVMDAVEAISRSGVGRRVASMRIAREILESSRNGLRVVNHAVSMGHGVRVGTSLKGIPAAAFKTGSRIGVHGMRNLAIGLHLVRRVFIVVATVADIAIVINGWATEHPTIPIVQQALRNQQRNMAVIEEFLREIERLRRGH